MERQGEEMEGKERESKERICKAGKVSGAKMRTRGKERESEDGEVSRGKSDKIYKMRWTGYHIRETGEKVSGVVG